MMRTTRGSGAPVRSAEAMSACASRSRSCSSLKASRGISVVRPCFSGSDRLEAKSLDSVHVRAFQADQLRRAVAPRRVEVALVVEVGRARRELVGAQRLRLARLFRAGRRDELVVRSEEHTSELQSR